LGVINGSNKLEVGVDVERMNQFFVTQNFLQNELDFDITVRIGVPEFSFITVDFKDVFDASIVVKSDASGLDGIPLAFVKMLLSVVLPTGDAFV
jgi:carbohydrate-selective porin OprB